MRRFVNRRFSSDWIITPDLADELMALSVEMARQLGLLVDRQGVVQGVLVGDGNIISLPPLPRYSIQTGKLRGLRLIRTQPVDKGANISEVDIYYLGAERLDSVSVITGNAEGALAIESAHHILPSQEYLPFHEEGYSLLIPHEVSVTDLHSSQVKYKDFIDNFERDLYRELKELYKGDLESTAIVVGVFSSKDEVENQMNEMSELAKSAGFNIIGTVVQIKRGKGSHSRTVVGSGKLREMLISAYTKGASYMIFANDLTPAQMKSVTDIAEVTVMDRTQLILDIFAKRATSNEGKIRVELARLKHYLPYLVGSYENLSRIVGGMQVRGSGETKLEIDRRRIQDRINLLAKRLERIERSRDTQRARRERNEIPVISIVGYTNAGKSTILNTMTQSDTYADDRLFATLDTASKRIRFPEDRDVIITDTVGFIRDLPEDLAGSFKSTLEELTYSDILMHVVDASSKYVTEHIISVRKILTELELASTPTLIVFNKCDLINDEEMKVLKGLVPNALFISALDKSSLRQLVGKLQEMIIF